MLFRSPPDPPTKSQLARLPLNSPQDTARRTPAERIVVLADGSDHVIDLLCHMVGPMPADKLSKRTAVKLTTRGFELLCEQLCFREHFIRNGYGYFHTNSMTSITKPVKAPVENSGSVGGDSAGIKHLDLGMRGLLATAQSVQTRRRLYESVSAREVHTRKEYRQKVELRSIPIVTNEVVTQTQRIFQ